jgi:hypothetical protein
MSAENSEQVRAKAEGHRAMFGDRILQLSDHLAQWSETPHGLTCTYLSSAPLTEKNISLRLQNSRGLSSGVSTKSRRNIDEKITRPIRRCGAGASSVSALALRTVGHLGARKTSGAPFSPSAPATRLFRRLHLR